MIRRGWTSALPLLLAAAIAAVWPVSAYAVSPVALPALVVAAGVAAAVLVRPDVGLALAVALSPLMNFVVQGHKPFQYLLPALAIGLALYGALLTPESQVASVRSASLGVIVFLGAALAASAQALDPHVSIKKILLLLTAVALYFAVLQVCGSERSLLTVAVGGVFALLVAGLHGFVQHRLGTAGVAGFVVNGKLVTRVQGSFGHPNQYGGYLAFLIPVALAVLFSRSFRPFIRGVAAVALVMGTLGLLYSYARGAVLGLAVGLLIWLAVVRPRLAVVAAIALALIGFVFAPSTLRDRFSSSAVSADAPIRTDIWGAAVDISTQHPFLGVGVNNFSVAYSQLPSTQLPHASQRRFLDNAEYLTPPHAQNLYLNVLAEEGIVGLGALCILLGAATRVFYRGTKLRDARGRAICVGTGAGLMTLLVHSVLEVTLTTELALPFFALLGVASVYLGREQREVSAAAPA